ncbi:Aminoacyl tRNA synthase complex-interacting multifunctional protein 1 [Entophlyctis luteolus]|nr:Aminoacyl tRNA synthase complex-interacting multifunctional protein 1 [Entophlyctis luteolus]
MSILIFSIICFLKHQTVSETFVRIDFVIDRDGMTTRMTIEFCARGEGEDFATGRLECTEAFEATRTDRFKFVAEEEEATESFGEREDTDCDIDNNFDCFGLAPAGEPGPVAFERDASPTSKRAPRLSLLPSAAQDDVAESDASAAAVAGAGCCGAILDRVVQQKNIKNIDMSPVSLTLDPLDLFTGVLLEALAIAPAALAVSRWKDTASPTATLPDGTKVTGAILVAKLLLELSGSHPEWAGSNEAMKAAVAKQMDAALLLQKTLGTDAKDTALLAKSSKQSRLEFCNVTRYFDLIQRLVRAVATENSITVTDLVEIDLDVPSDDIPLLSEARRKGDAGSSQTPKEKVDNASPPAAPAAEKKQVSAAKRSKTDEDKKAGGKSSEEKKPAVKDSKTDPAKGSASKPEETENSKPEPERLDLRVGHIVTVKKHPDAETLYVEEIDVGESKPRTVVSGLVKFMKEEDLLGRKVVLLCNLKPAKMRGIESQAMVLAATSVDGTKVELLDAPNACKPGTRCWFDSYRGSDFSQLNPKKKTWENVQPGLKTDGFRQAVYSVTEAGVTVNRVLRTEEGEITVKSVTGATIK